MAETSAYDLAVLGSGPGGYVAALRAGQLGLKTVVIEKEDLYGGTCLHVGCIPTKALLHTAEFFDKLRRAKELGVVTGEVGINWTAIQKRKERVVRKLATGISYLFKKSGIEAVQGFGRIAGAGKIEVEGKDGTSTVYARNILIGTGSEPRSLPGLDIDGHSVLTNEEILSLPERPKSLAVIGAGAVGVEFASMFASFGTKVLLLEVLPRILPIEDEEVSLALARSFKKRGIESLTGTRVESVRSEGGSVEIKYTRPDGEAGTKTVDKLLVAVGRQPRTEGIGLETLGIKTEKGMIPVDGTMEIPGAKGCYAIGDVVQSQQFAHVASAEGILAVEKIAGLDVRPLNYDHMPSCTYCTPEVASVGLSESKAKEKGLNVQVGRFPFGANSKAGILGEGEGFVKVVSETGYDELLGVHIIGPHATELIAEACVALAHEATTESLMRVVHPHPTLSEAVMEASHGAALGHSIHI